MEDKNLQVVKSLQDEIVKIEDQIIGCQKEIVEKKTLIAALTSGFGVGDVVTDGGVEFLVHSFSGSHWKGYRRKKDGKFSENEEYIKGNFKKKEEPLNIEMVDLNKEP